MYWTWDARLTTFALLFLLFLGYLVVRRLPADMEVRNRRSAFVGMLAFIDVPIVYLSVELVAQPAPGRRRSALSSQIAGLMLFTLVLGFVVVLLGYAWLLVHRFRVAWLEDEVESSGLDLAIAERRAEAATVDDARRRAEVSAG